MDGDPGNLIWKFVLLFALILVNAFFTMSEVAIITLNDAKLQSAAEDGDKRAKKVLRITQNPTGFLSAVQICVNLAQLFTASAASVYLRQPLCVKLANLFNANADAAWVGVVSTVIITLIISFFCIVFGTLVPKRIAMQRCEKIAYRVSSAVLFFKVILKPFSAILNFTTNIFVRILGFDPNADEEEVTEEEIRMLVDAGEEKGVIEESQKEMINNIFEFDDIVAGDVMTHRTDIEAVEIKDNFSDVLQTAITAGYSRLPVYEDDLDNIKGVVYVKDLLKYVGKTLPKSLKIPDIMRKPFFFPETKRCGDLFSEMTEKHLQLVFVCDEYGGIAGIVTMEDLLESIVGNMQDEYDNEKEDIEKINDTTFNLDGTTDIEEVEDILDVKFPEGEYDTIGGLIMNELGRIPGEDEHPTVDICGYSFTVNLVDDRRIEQLTAVKLPENTQTDGKEDKDEAE